MKLTVKQLNLRKKATDSLLFDDLYEFILSIWPDAINTSNRESANYATMIGLVAELVKMEDHQQFLENCEIGNLLVHLDYAFK